MTDERSGSETSEAAGAEASESAKSETPEAAGVEARESTGAEASADARADEDETDADPYRGVVGAVTYAVRASDSVLFRTYAVVGGLLAGGIVLVFALALVTLLGQSASVPGGMFTFSRAFLLVIMLLVLVPVIAPVLVVARRHRRTGSTVGYDRALAATGYLFLAALYVGLVVSAPASLTDDPGGGPVGAGVRWLYGLPRAAGVVPPLVAAGLEYLVHRHVR